MLILATTLVAASASSLDANEPLSMAVSPAQSFAPTNLSIRIHVEPDDLNRALEVVVDSGEYFRSSRIQLEGSGAPRRISFEFRNVPGGDYEIRSTLIGGAEMPRAAVRGHVVVIDSREREPSHE